MKKPFMLLKCLAGALFHAVFMWFFHDANFAGALKSAFWRAYGRGQAS